MSLLGRLPGSPRWAPPIPSEGEHPRAEVPRPVPPRCLRRRFFPVGDRPLSPLSLDRGKGHHAREAGAGPDPGASVQGRPVRLPAPRVPAPRCPAVPPARSCAAGIPARGASATWAAHPLSVWDGLYLQGWCSLGVEGWVGGEGRERRELTFT